MRRVLAMLATTAATLMLAGGCAKSYDIRMSKTLERMRYEKRLDDNLIAAPKGTKFETYHIFVRPPLNLKGPSKEFLLGVQEPGKFELTESFLEGNKQSLHVLARVKVPKDPTKKKAAPKPEDAVVRGEFNADVIAIVNSVYAVELDPAKAKEESKKPGNVKNVYRHLKFEGNGKDVQVYLNGKKGDPYEVALIFEYPKAEEAALISKIELCLESFATGERAPAVPSPAAAPRKSKAASRPPGRRASSDQRRRFDRDSQRSRAPSAPGRTPGRGLTGFFAARRLLIGFDQFGAENRDAPGRLDPKPNMVPLDPENRDPNPLTDAQRLHSLSAKHQHVRLRIRELTNGSQEPVAESIEIRFERPTETPIARTKEPWFPRPIFLEAPGSARGGFP